MLIFVAPHMPSSTMRIIREELCDLPSALEQAERHLDELRIATEARRKATAELLSRNAPALTALQVLRQFVVWMCLTHEGLLCTPG